MLSFIFVWKWVTETKGVSLEDMHADEVASDELSEDRHRPDRFDCGLIGEVPRPNPDVDERQEIFR